MNTTCLSFSILFLVVLLCIWSPVEGFSIPSEATAKTRLLRGRRYNFLKNLVEKAFENDSNLNRGNDMRTGQIDEAIDEDDDDYSSSYRRLTATQEMWRKKTSQVADLTGKSFDFDFYLTGVPEKDPSNDLFGARVNISSRDRKVGQALPEQPTLSNIRIAFLENGKCVCETDTPFTVVVSAATSALQSHGDWKLSEDGNQVRFRIPVTGFTRTIETRGTIQSVFWSKEPGKASRTSTTYSIPAGWLYGEARISLSSRPGQLLWKEGILKIEQFIGVLGAGIKMSPCGKFEARSATAAGIATMAGSSISNASADTNSIAIE